MWREKGRGEREEEGSSLSILHMCVCVCVWMCKRSLSAFVFIVCPSVCAVVVRAVGCLSARVSAQDYDMIVKAKE